jgi:hypothetical protein
MKTNIIHFGDHAMTAHSIPTETTTIQRPSVARVLLGLEGAALFVVAVLLYRQFTDFGWLFFAVFLLAPDLAMLPYLLNKRAGMMGYNAAHTFVAPLALLGLAVVFGWGWGLALGFVWLAHIGMDRAAGYGLKYRTDFKETHLNRV